MLGSKTFRVACGFIWFGLVVVAVTGGRQASAAAVAWTGSADSAWDNPVNWSPQAMPLGTDTAVFDGTASQHLNNIALNAADRSVFGLREISPSGDVTIVPGNTLTIGSNGIDMSSATRNLTLNCGVQLGADQSWAVNSGQTLTVTGGLGGGGGLTYSGGGLTTLSGPNVSYTGPTTISSGTLALADVGNNFVSPTSIASTATLIFNATDTGVDTNIIGFNSPGTTFTGNGTIIKTGAGWTELDYNVIQSFAGQINIQAGTLGNGYGRATWGDSTTGMNVDVATGAWLDLRGNGIAVAALTGSGSVVNTYGNFPAIGNGTLTVGLNNASSTFSGSIMGDGTGTNDPDGPLSPNAGVTSLVKTGTGVFTLTGFNTYTGSTSINAGQLVLQDPLNYVSSTNIASGGTLNVALTNNWTVNTAALNITGGGTLLKTGTGTWIVGAPGQHVNFNMSPGGLIDIEGGTIQNNWNGTSFGNNQAHVNIAAGAVLDFYAENGQMDYLTGAGTLQNGYGGGVHGVTIGVADGSGTFSGIIQDGSGVPLSLTKIGTGVQTFSGSGFTYTGPTAISGGTLVLDNVGNNFVSSTSIASSATLVFSTTNSAVDTNIIGFNNTGTAFSGSGTIIKSGSGWTELDYNVIQGFAGQINIQAGTLGNGFGRSTWGASTTGMSVDVASGAWLDLRGNGIAVAKLTGSGSVVNTFSDFATIGNGTLTVGVNNATSTFSGSILGDGTGTNNPPGNPPGTTSPNAGVTSLVKTGSGIFTLTGSSTYTGPTAVSAGTLQIGNGAQGGILTFSNVTTAPGATLAINLASNGVFANSVTNSGSLNAMTSAVNAISGAISGPGSLNVTGGGLVVISGTNNTYTGATVVSSGTLQLGQALLGNAASSAFHVDASGLTPGAITSLTNLGLSGGSITGNASVSVGAIDGHTALTFDGLGQSLTSIGNVAYSNTTSNAITVFMVVQRTGHGSDYSSPMGLNVPGSPDFNSDSALIPYYDMAGTQAPGAFRNGQLPQVANPIPQGTPVVSETQINGPSYQIWTTTTGGTQTAQGGTADAIFNIQDLYLGQRFDGGVRWYQGDVGEVLIFNSALTAAQSQAIQNYLAYKWLGIGRVNLLPTATALQIAASSAVDLNGANQQIASLSDYNGSGGTVTNSGGYASVLTVSSTDSSTSTTFSGTIQDGPGGVSLVLSNGTLVLAGSNTYTGGTSVQGGTLIVANSSGLADGTSLTVGADAATIFGLSAAGTPTASQAVSPVPEPGTLVLLAAALCGGAVYRRLWRPFKVAAGRQLPQTPVISPTNAPKVCSAADKPAHSRRTSAAGRCCRRCPSDRPKLRRSRC